MEYIQNENPEECVFCAAPSQTECKEGLIIHLGKRAFVILNRFPYTSGHLMVIPYEHKSSLELLNSETRSEIMDLASKAIEVLRAEYHPEGFNLGVNIGEVAGAGIAEHVHLHVVPRWKGDTNFMSSLGETRVLPEALSVTCERIRNKWMQFEAKP